MEESKKISFSFVKSVKKPLVDKQVSHEKKKEYIECLDEKAIKVIGKGEEKKEPLVIPLLKSKAWHDRIINKVNADIFTRQINKNKNDVSNIQQAVSSIQIKTVLPDKNESILDEQAAKEIIEDLKSREEKDKINDLTLPIVKGQDLNGAEESVLEDYENVPVEDFGLAMLRGMGWKSGEGIGKNPKLVETIVHEVRPMGMGLGADKIALQKLQDRKPKKEEEELKIEKESFIKVIVGKRCNQYGQIEGFDDAGRLIIKMALNGNTISVNESIVQAVTKAEYLKNSKVLNAAKYEEHKQKEDASKERSLNYSNGKDSDSDSSIFERKRKHKKKDNEHKTKKSKDRQRDSYGSDSDNKKNRKRRHSSSSDKTKKAKKSKKHKEKDKERERRRDKNSESFVRRKTKKHRRSRSSSRR